MSKSEFRLGTLNRADSEMSSDYGTMVDCCNEDQSESKNAGNMETVIEMPKINSDGEGEGDGTEISNEEKLSEDRIDGQNRNIKKRTHACGENNNWAEHKNVAEGLMDIALLSANANQLRFLITYNNKASTYYISLGLIALSLILQVAVGIALIFKRRMKNSRIRRTRTRINEFLIGGVFMVTVVNVLLAAFTTTDGPN